MIVILYSEKSVCSLLQSIIILGGVMISVLATGLSVFRFNPADGDGFLRAIKSTAHLVMEGK
jgi:hypothetical protein